MHACSELGRISLYVGLRLASMCWAVQLQPKLLATTSFIIVFLKYITEGGPKNLAQFFVLLSP